MKRKLSREKKGFRWGRLRRSEAEEEGEKRAVQDQSDFTGISRTKSIVFFSLQRDCPFTSTVAVWEVLNEIRVVVRRVMFQYVRLPVSMHEGAAVPFSQYLYTFLLVKILLTTKCPPRHLQTFCMLSRSLRWLNLVRTRRVEKTSSHVQGNTNVIFSVSLSSCSLFAFVFFFIQL